MIEQWAVGEDKLGDVDNNDGIGLADDLLHVPRLELFRSMVVELGVLTPSFGLLIELGVLHAIAVAVERETCGMAVALSDAPQLETEGTLVELGVPVPEIKGVLVSQGAVALSE